MTDEHREDEQREEEQRRLKRIAVAQRLVIFAILGYFLTALSGALLGSSEWGRAAAWSLGLLTGALSLFGSATLAYRLFGTPAAIACGLAMFLPVVGFVVLLTLSGMTNRRMKDAGAKVGLLFGTQLKQFD